MDHSAPREDGKAERPVQTAAVFANKVERLDGEFLICNPDEKQNKKPDSAMLSDFIALVDAEPSLIFKYARKWGALGIFQTLPSVGAREPIEEWRRTASRLRAIRNIGADVNNQGHGEDDDWLALGIKNLEYIHKSRKEARFALMSQVRRLIDESELRPRLFWNPATSQWQIDFDSYKRSNLLAILVIQLMIEVADKDGYAICSNCRRSYVPKRKPALGRRNYCDKEVCRRAAWSDSKRDQRRHSEVS